jgi:hypothetical protein
MGGTPFNQAMMNTQTGSWRRGCRGHQPAHAPRGSHHPHA